MMKIYVIGSAALLGKRTGQVVKGLRLESASQVDTIEFVNYKKEKAMGNLLVLNIGDGKDVLEINLSKKQVITLATVKAKFKAAKKMSRAWLVNSVFDDCMR